ncbi:MAG TPA: hypothetical protein VLI06_05430 [Solimonas sp.]|nr:hypothetical protein [Solimonas sp.]
MKMQTMSMRAIRTAAALCLSLAAAVAQAKGAAEVMLLTGVATATAPGQSARSLHRGDAVNAGETLQVGRNSYLSLAFADGGRVLLRPNTSFEIEAYEYSAAAPTAAPAPAAEPAADATAPTPAASGNRAFFKLLRGGFRAVSGLIGKQEQNAYLVRTTVATIGIRGTDYFAELCSGEECGGPYMPLQADLSEALQVGVEEGAIEVTTSQGVFPVTQGQYGLAAKDGQFFNLPMTPMSQLYEPFPKPEGCE